MATHRLHPDPQFDKLDLMAEFERILIANRTDCARRIARTCIELGKTPIVLYTADDKESLHVKEAVEAYEIPNYGDLRSIIEVGQRMEVDAIHPGWGFVSENPKFPKACEKAGVIFIGPSEETMRKAGDKERIKRAAKKLAVPVIDSSSRVKKSNISEWAARNGLSDEENSVPVMLKAAKSGGGTGNKVVYRLSNLEEEVSNLKNSSQKLWGRSRIFAERLVRNPRHVEVQLFGDENGNLIHLGSRDCTVQYEQKVIEEAPAPFLTLGQEKLIHEYALAIGKSIEYTGAGTAEFLMSRDGEILFMEFNPRLQVEHGITEMITNLDLVKLQILVAEGKRLPSQKKIKFRGSAIEARVDALTIYDAHPERLITTGGMVEDIEFPKGENVRVDHALYKGYEINTRYNRTQAKVMAWSSDRSGAIENLKSALEDFKIDGVITNIPLLNSALSHEKFVRGEHSTTFFEEMLREMAEKRRIEKEMAGAIGAGVALAFQERQENEKVLAHQEVFSPWRHFGRIVQMRR